MMLHFCRQIRKDQKEKIAREKEMKRQKHKREDEKDGKTKREKHKIEDVKTET